MRFEYLYHKTALFFERRFLCQNVPVIYQLFVIENIGYIMGHPVSTSDGQVKMLKLIHFRVYASTFVGKVVIVYNIPHIFGIFISADIAVKPRIEFQK